MDLSSQNWKTYRDTPKEIVTDGAPQGYTEDVLIDVDGRRKTFRVGFYDTEDHEWKLYDTDEEIDLGHMKWTELPLDKD